MPRKLKVFLCHSSNDKPAVRDLYQRLKSEGWIDPWLDEEKLYPGQDWDREIEIAVEETELVIAFLSNNSISKGGYIQFELRTVLNMAKYKPAGTLFIAPIRLDNCKVPRSLKMWQFVDYFPENRKDWAYQRILGSLKIRAEKLGIDFESIIAEKKSIEQEKAREERRKKIAIEKARKEREDREKRKREKAEQETIEKARKEREAREKKESEVKVRKISAEKSRKDKERIESREEAEQEAIEKARKEREAKEKKESEVKARKISTEKVRKNKEERERKVAAEKVRQELAEKTKKEKTTSSSFPEGEGLGVRGNPRNQNPSTNPSISSTSLGVWC